MGGRLTTVEQLDLAGELGSLLVPHFKSIFNNRLDDESRNGLISCLQALPTHLPDFIQILEQALADTQLSDENCFKVVEKLNEIIWSEILTKKLDNPSFKTAWQSFFGFYLIAHDSAKSYQDTLFYWSTTKSLTLEKQYLLVITHLALAQFKEARAFLLKFLINQPGHGYAHALMSLLIASQENKRDRSAAIDIHLQRVKHYYPSVILLLPKNLPVLLRDEPLTSLLASHASTVAVPADLLLKYLILKEKYKNHYSDNALFSQYLLDFIYTPVAQECEDIKKLFIEAAQNSFPAFSDVVEKAAQRPGCVSPFTRMYPLPTSGGRRVLDPNYLKTLERIDDGENQAEIPKPGI